MAEAAAGGEAAAAAPPAQAAAAPEQAGIVAMPAPPNNNNNNAVHNELLRYLVDLAARPASHEHLAALAGQHQNQNITRAAIATLWTSDAAEAYLQAVSKHLMGTGGGAAGGGAGAAAAVFNNHQVMTDLLQNIAASVPKVEPRSKIAATGILSALDRLQNQFAGDEDVLSPAKIEFLQACLWADMHVLAEQQIQHSWPRPVHKQRFGSGAITAQQVLRYYYLRGCVHAYCRHWPLAVRCFWTCLSVPAADNNAQQQQNAVSAIAVAAWKKLVLVQCVLADSLEHNSNSDRNQSRGGGAAKKSDSVSVFGTGSSSSGYNPPRTGPLSVPKEMPSSLLRFLSNAPVPPGSRSLGSGLPERASGSGTDSPMASPPRRLPPPPEEHPDAMHMVEMDASDVMAMVGIADHGGSNDNDGSGGGDNRSNSMPSLGVRVYRELVQAFLAVDRPTFDAIVAEHEALFREDGNYGLAAAQVGTVLRHRQVYAVSSLYAALPLPQLAAELQLESPAAAQALLQQLATDRQWPVTMEGGGGVQPPMVVFPRAPPVATAGVLSSEELVQLTKMVRELDMQLASSSKYAAYLRKKGPGKTDKSGGGPRGVEDI